MWKSHACTFVLRFVCHLTLFHVYHLFFVKIYVLRKFTLNCLLWIKIVICYKEASSFCAYFRSSWTVVAVFKLLFCSDLLREAVKPSPAQPTHRVAVHIPSQQDVDSDSDTEEVRHPHIAVNCSSQFHPFLFSLSFALVILPNMYTLITHCVTAGCS